MAEANCTPMTRAEYRANVRRDAAGNFVCINCGKDAYRRISWTNKSNGIENKYCCMACRTEHSKRRLRIKAFVASEVMAIRRLGKAKYKPTKKRCTCPKCGAMFIAKLGGGLHQQFCQKCIDESNAVARRVAKARRRSLIRSARVESVDPFKVFDRDKWRCKLCGAKTPKSKRGTYADDAPELDHIIPVSKGGDHTYLNTQCTCRKCNGSKSDRPLGQMLLIG